MRQNLSKFFSYTIALIVILLVFVNSAVAQGHVGVGTKTPDPSAMLDITSTNSGLLIPRIALQAINVAAPVIAPIATGVTVFNTNPAVIGGSGIGYYYWSQVTSTWVKLSASNDPATDWSLIGNIGTNPDVNFLGTTDDKDLVFKTKNVEGIRMNSADQSVGIGVAPLNGVRVNVKGTIRTDDKYDLDNASFVSNGGDPAQLSTFVGRGAGTVISTGISNTFIGASAGSKTTIGNSNTFIGDDAGRSNTTGKENVYIGISAGGADFGGIGTGIGTVGIGPFAGSKNGGTSNVFIGDHSGIENLNATKNTFVGGYTGFSIVNGGSSNTFIGYEAGRLATSGNNTFVGTESGKNNVNGFNNTFIGFQAGNFSGGAYGFSGGYKAGIRSVGNSNTIIGHFAGAPATIPDANLENGVWTSSGDNNVFIGTKAGPASANIISTAIAIGYHASVGGANSIAIGANAAVANNITNSIAIGNNVTVNANNVVQLGNSLVRVSIGDNQGGLPSANLDVDGTVSFGPLGTVFNNIFTTTVAADLGIIPAGSTSFQEFTLANTTPGATVFLTPATNIQAGIALAWARVENASKITVALSNVTAAPVNPNSITFKVLVVQ